ncbi:MAG TPA: hypothetical protein VIG64_08385, partial [Actinomycetota bacterium]
MAAASDTTVITGATVLIGRDLVAVTDRSVVLASGKIERIASSHDLPNPTSAAMIDAAGLVLLPGFVDAHVHIGFHSPADVLRGGVTTVRDLGWPPEVIWPLARASQEDEFEGPAVHAVGPILTAPGGYPSRAEWAPQGTALEVNEPDEARTAVDRVHRDGATAVK